MNTVSLSDITGKPIRPPSATISVAAPFPHLAVCDVTIVLPQCARSSHTLIIKGQPNVPSLRLLFDGVATTEFELLSSDVSEARLVVHIPRGADTMTLQWHASFVPIDNERFVLPLPVVPTQIEGNGEQEYRVAVDWGSELPTTDIVDKGGYHLIATKRGAFDTAFDFNCESRVSLAMFVTVKTKSAGGVDLFNSTTLAGSFFISLVRNGGLWIVSALIALLATYIIGK